MILLPTLENFLALWLNSNNYKFKKLKSKIDRFWKGVGANDDTYDGWSMKNAFYRHFKRCIQLELTNVVPHPLSIIWWSTHSNATFAAQQKGNASYLRRVIWRVRQWLFVTRFKLLIEFERSNKSSRVGRKNFGFVCRNFVHLGTDH